MKKIFVSMAFAAMMFAPLSVMAQTNNTANTATEKTCCKVDGNKKQKDGKKAKGEGRAEGEKKEKRNPFEGLNLTADQQTKIQQLNDKRKAEREKMMAERKAAKENGQAQKENAQKPSREEMAAKRQADKKAYLTEIQTILTPDQYVVFLENFYTNNGKQGGKQMGKMAQKDGKAKSGKQNGKSGKQGDRKKGEGKQGQRAQAKTGNATAQS